MGLPPSEVEQFGASDIDLLTRYWNEEPWGPYRDNIHAALIAREVRRSAFKGEHKLDDFILRGKKEEKAGWSKESVFGMFKALAGGRKKSK